MGRTFNIMSMLENGYFDYKELLLSLPESDALELQKIVKAEDLIEINDDGVKKYIIRGEKICPEEAKQVLKMMEKLPMAGLIKMVSPALSKQSSKKLKKQEIKQEVKTE